MLRKQKPAAKRLKILMALLWTLAFLHAAPARAFPLNFTPNTPEGVARFHCRLLLYQAEDTDFLPEDKYLAISGERGYRYGMSPENLLAMNQLIGIAPEMDFIIGPRWQTFTREQRMRFNRTFSRLIITRYALKTPEKYEDSCEMKASYFQGEKALTTPVEAPKLDKEKPARAIVTTEVPTAIGMLPVSYVLMRRPPARWVIEDMLVHAESLGGIYRDNYNLLLANEGTAEFLSYLQDTLKKKQSKKAQ